MSRPGLYRATRYRAYTHYSRRGHPSFGRLWGYAIVVALLVAPAVIFSRTEEQPMAVASPATESARALAVNPATGNPEAGSTVEASRPVMEKVSEKNLAAPAAPVIATRPAEPPTAPARSPVLPPSLSSAPALETPAIEASPAPAPPRTERATVQKSRPARAANASRSKAPEVREARPTAPSKAQVERRDQDPPPMRRPM